MMSDCTRFSVDPFDIPFESIKDLQWLGSGAQGAVFLGHYNGQPVAVKKVKSLAEVEDVKPLRKLNHVNLVAFKYDKHHFFIHGK